jgi:membrane protease YdiL (CAAX protease family)
VGPYGDVLTPVSFLFRFVAGLLFTGLYYWRGFAVTAYAHACYDIRVTLFTA